MDNSRDMGVAPHMADIKEQTVGKLLQPTVQRRTSGGLRLFEPFPVSNLRIKQERMPAKIGHSGIFLDFTSLPASRIRAPNGVVAGLGGAHRGYSLR